MNRRAQSRYAVLASLIGAALVVAGAPEAWHRVTGKPWDGQQEWWCAHFWWKGLDPYAPSSLPLINIGVLGHPPSTSFYALPLALFDLSLMGRLLGGACIALLFTQLLITARELRLPSPPATALAVFGLVWVSPFFLYHLGVAQVSELIGFCYFLTWYWLRREREVPAGIALGLACTLKLYPGGLVLFLALGRRWRGVLAAGVTWLAVAALMTSRFGLACWREYFAGEKQVVNWWIGHASNVTFQGVVLRILHPACVADSFADPTAARIATALSLLLLGGVWWLSHRHLRRANRIDLPFTLFVLWSLLANAFYWEHYDVILILPLAIVGTALWRARARGLSRAWQATSVLALGVAVWGTLIPPNNARILLRAVRLNPSPTLHLRAHVLEIGAALPMPLLLIVAAGLLAWFSRRDFFAESGRLAVAESAGLSTAAKPAGLQGAEAGTPPA